MRFGSWVLRWVLSLVLGSSACLVSTGAWALTTVEMETSKGTITLALDEDKAPATVANFLVYVRDGHYKGTIFHRVIEGFMIQGGGFDQQVVKKSTQDPVPNEAYNGLKNQRGTIAMARTSDPHSATAQFFINLKRNDFLDFRSRSRNGWGYTVFGRVVKGMDVVDAIAKVKTQAVRAGFPPRPFKNKPVEDVVIKSVRVL